MDDGEIAINSPFMEDTTYDCRINIDKQCWHDFESDEGGNIEELVAELADVDVDKAKNILIKNITGKATIEKSDYNRAAEVIPTNTIELPPGTITFNKKEKKGYISNKRKAIQFLADKMVDYKLVEKYNLLWTENCLVSYGEKRINLSNRIIIPTYENGNLIYYQARDYTGKDEVLRYKNPPKEMQKKVVVVPFYDKLKKNKELFISEGPWEAIQYSGTYMLGPGLTDRQLLKIKEKSPKAIYIIPDNDATGRHKLIKNIQAIKRFLDCPIFIVKWWENHREYKDPIDAKIDFDTLLESEVIEATKQIELKIQLGAIE
jgi:hypothetical protein